MSDRPNIQEIIPGVWRVGGHCWGGTIPCISHGKDSNVYLLAMPEGPLLVDVGSPEGKAAIEANIEATGTPRSQLKTLLLTHSHYDHTQATSWWQRDYPLTTYLNAVGADFLARGDERLIGYQVCGPGYDHRPFRVNQPTEDGACIDCLGAELEVVHLPGHTPDSTAYLFEHRGRRIGISGDVVFNANAQGMTGLLGWLNLLWLSNVEDYRASLQKLQARLPIDALFPGHGHALIGQNEVAAAIDSALASVERLLSNNSLVFHGLEP